MPGIVGGRCRLFAWFSECKVTQKFFNKAFLK